MSVPFAIADPVVFSQNFSAGGAVGDYDDAAAPTANQFNLIGAGGSQFVWSLSDNALQGSRNGSNTGTFSRTTDLATTNLFYFQLDLNITAISTPATTALTFQFGSDYTANNSPEANGSTHSRFAINLVDTSGGWQVRDISGNVNSSTFTGSHKVTFVTNNSGAGSDYVVSGSIFGTLANDTFDLWVDNTQVFNDRAVLTPAFTSVTDFKTVWNAGVGSASFDNIVLGTVPEPSVSCFLLGAVAILFNRRHRRANRA